MTPAIQKQSQEQGQDQSQYRLKPQTREQARDLSINLTCIFKKMKPFPKDLRRPPLIAGLDLGAQKWHVAFNRGSSTSRCEITGIGKHHNLIVLTLRLMRRLGIEDTSDVVFCYEIGRDGLWVRDWLWSSGFACVVLSSDALAGSGREAKTDRLDATRLATRLWRFYEGSLEIGHVHMPPPDDIQDGRVLSRAREDMVAQRTRHANQIKSILARHEEVPACLNLRKFEPDEARDVFGNPLPPNELDHLKRLHRLYLEVDAEVAELDRRMKECLAAARKAIRKGEPVTRRETMLCKLAGLKGIGVHAAWNMVHECFYKRFSNTSQVGAATGLVAIPRASGSSCRCAGISRQSNGRLRGTLVELAWMWRRHQPDSALSKWFSERTQDGVSQRRMRKVAIVAVARKLAVALWKYLAQGIVPEGAVLSAG